MLKGCYTAALHIFACWPPRSRIISMLGTHLAQFGPFNVSHFQHPVVPLAWLSVVEGDVEMGALHTGGVQVGEYSSRHVGKLVKMRHACTHCVFATAPPLLPSIGAPPAETPALQALTAPTSRRKPSFGRQAASQRTDCPFDVGAAHPV